MESLIRLDHTHAEPWMFLVFLLALALLAYVHNVYPSRYSKLFRATFNERMTRQVMREEMVFSHRASLILLLVSALVLSLIAFLILEDRFALTGVPLFLALFLATSVLFILRQGIRGFLTMLIGTDAGLREYNFVSALIAKVLGLGLFPISLCMIYMNKQWVLGLLVLVGAVFLVAFSYRIYRGWRIGRYYGGPAYYLITYLCALELIPTLVFIKIIMLNVTI